MVKFDRSVDHDRNAGRCPDGSDPCAVCGRSVERPWPHWVRLGEGGSVAVTAEEARANPSADLGCWPVGSCCWRRHEELHQYGA